MSQQVVTELVIDSNTSGADQFSQSMDKASASAQQGIGSVAGLTLAVAGVGVAFIGSLAALRGFVDYVGNTNKELIDLAANAANAGMTTKTFQETLFAAKASGLTDKDFVAGLDKIGADLQAASRGATDFGKLFEANGISIKNLNGDLKTTEQAMGSISSLIKNAPTLQMANAIASIVGLSKDWVPFLRQGVDGIEAQKKAAADLGVTIDDATISKAKDFNDQWHKAVATWDMQFKASLASILPLLTQMATLASTIIDGVGAISGSVSRWTTPDDQKSKQQLNDQAEDVIKLIDLMDRFKDSASVFPQVKIANLQRLLGLPEGGTMEDAIALLDKMSALYDKAPTKLTVSPTGNGSTVLPPSSLDRNDPVDRAINTLQKHIETQKADTLAVGLGDAALAGFRATAAETSAVLANGGKETAEQAAKFAVLKQNVIDATEAFTRAKIANDISFGRKTAFLSAEDVQIAQQLKGIYPDVATALNSVQAAGIRTNNAMKGLSQALETSLTTGLGDIVAGTKSVSQGFNDMALSVVKAIEQMIIKLYIITPLMQALQSTIGGGPITLGGPNGPTPFASANGNIFDGGNVVPFARGGIVDGPTIAPMALFGEDGPEAIVPLRRGPDGNLGVASAGGGGTQVNVNVMNFGNDNVSVTQQPNAAGGIDLEVMVGQAAASQMAKKGSALRQVTDNRARIASR